MSSHAHFLIPVAQADWQVDGRGVSERSS